jgi:hypothetical protein
MPTRTPNLCLAKMQTGRPDLYLAKMQTRGPDVKKICRIVDLMCKDVDTGTSYVKDADIETYFAV